MSFRLKRLLCCAFIAAPVLAPAAFADDASCDIDIGNTHIDGPCVFTPRKDGSFGVTMQDGTSFAGARELSLDIVGKRAGTLSDSNGRSLGLANRSPTDAACWIAEEASVCVRALEDPRSGQKNAISAAPFGDLPRVVTGRCHMDSCWWVRIEEIEEIGTGSDDIPGRRLLVKLSHASSEMAVEDYENVPAPDADIWGDPVHDQYFCSMIRPAVLTDDQGWTVLPLPSVFGATEGATNIYLDLCHGHAERDPYEAVKELGYDVAHEDQSFRTFADLITP